MANGSQHEIIVDHLLVPSSQTGLPMLGQRSQYDDEMFDPIGSFRAKSDGTDKRYYTNNDQTGELSREIVDFAYDSVLAAGDGLCVDWIQGDSFVLSPTVDTSYYVTYDDLTQADYGFTDTFGRDSVWAYSPDAFLTVLHLVESGSDGTSGEFTDSTGSGITGKGGGGFPSAVSTNHPWGGTWQDFDGSTDKVDIENSASTMDSSDGTVLDWAFVDANSGADEGIVSNRDSSDGTNFFQLTDDSSGTLAFIHDGTENVNATRGTAIGTTTTTHSGLTWSASRVTSYHQGAQDQEDTSLAGDGHFSNSFGIRIATYFDGSASRTVNGRIGEVWLLLSQITDNRVTTLYNNQSNSAWASSGTPTRIGSVAVVITSINFIGI